MSIKRCKFIPRALAVSGMLIGLFLVNPASYAGDAQTMVPARDIELPAGSQIPERRLLETEKKVEALKAKMRAERAAQQQRKSLPEAESAKPEAEKP